MALINLEQLKCPYFDVRVGPPGLPTEKLIPLPDSLRSILVSFEYSEMIDGGRGSAARIRLTFYDNIHKSTAVLDQKFSTIGDATQITYVTPEEIALGKSLYNKMREQESKLGKILVPSNATPQQIEVNEKKRQATEKTLQELQEQLSKTSADFVFQERNIVEVTWGYKDALGQHPDLQPRTVRGEILQINYKASAGDIPLTEILAVDIGSGEMSKIYRKEGVNFSNKLVKEKIKIGEPLGITIKTPAGEVITRSDDAPARIDDIFRAVADSYLKNTIAHVDLTDEEKYLDIQDNTSSRNWTQGTNLHDFLMELAEKIYANYYVTVEYRNGTLKTILNLISRRKFEASSAMHFLWKSGLGSEETTSADSGEATIFNTIKDFELALYPSGGSGASSSGISSLSKESVGSSANRDEKYSYLLTEQSELDFNKGQAQKLNDRDPENAILNDSQGMSTYSPSSSDSQHESIANKMAGRMERGLRLSFTSIGIPKFKPGVIKVSNIGTRYSGLYSILSVTHRISIGEGYICTAMGETNVVKGGGVSAKSAPVRNDLDRSVKFNLLGDTPLDFEKGIDVIKKALGQ